MNYKKKTKILLSLLAATVGIIANPLKSEALTFDFRFDTTPDSTVTPPIVGTGTFSFDGDPGDGTFPLSTLPNFEFFFDFSGDTFTEDDIAVTNIANVLVIISTNGSTRNVVFDGSSGTSTGGSIDFENDISSFLTFQPSGGMLYASNTVITGLLGTFEGVASDEPPTTPEPTSLLALLGIGLSFAATKKKGT